MHTASMPEPNPHFRYLASTASELCRRVIDRCNLTILHEPGQEDLAEFLAEHRIEIIASLPFYQAGTVDRQPGRGTFEKSIEALRTLNALGYGAAGTSLVLNLVYNPAGMDLAPPQEELEERFKNELRDRFGVVFNRLFAMNNMPVNRFRDYLVGDDQHRWKCCVCWRSGLLVSGIPDETKDIGCCFCVRCLSWQRLCADSVLRGRELRRRKIPVA